MHSQVETRLRELNIEFTRGNTELQALQAKCNEYVEALLRIQGGIAALQELLVEHPSLP